MGKKIIFSVIFLVIISLVEILGLFMIISFICVVMNKNSLCEN